MSYYFDFSKFTYGPQTTAPTSEVTPVTAKKEASPASTIVMFTPQGNKGLRPSKQLRKACADNGVSFRHVPVLGRELASTITRLRSAGTIGNDTQIILSLHGDVLKNTEGGADLALGDSDSEEQDDGHALAILDAIRKPLEGSSGPCSATVYIAACGAGAKDFANCVQKLHNDYKAGVCFLLSSKGDVSDSEHNVAVNAICKQFISAKKCGAQSPTPDHIFAVLTARAGDCMSMVVANEAHPRTVHAPKNHSGAGAEGLVRRVDEDALIFREKGVSLGLMGARGENLQEEGQLPKASISGDLKAMEDYKKALLGLSEDEKQIGPIQGLRIAAKFARQSDPTILREYLETSPDFAGVKEKSWSLSHDYVIDLVGSAIQDDDGEWASEKVIYLAGLMSEAYDLAPDAFRSEFMKRIFKENPEGFYALNRAGFFIRPLETAEKKVEAAATFLAGHSDLKHLKETMALKVAGQKETVGKIWESNLSRGEEDAIRLSLQIIDAADGNRKHSAAIQSYVIETLRACECKRFLKERSTWISTKHPTALLVLITEGMF